MSRQEFFSNWNFLRIIRLVAGISILVYGYRQMDWLLIMIGTTFGIMAIVNSQCGPFSNSCKVEYNKKGEHEPS